MPRNREPCPNNCGRLKEKNAALCWECFVAQKAAKAASKVCPRCGEQKCGESELCKKCRNKQRRLDQQSRNEFTGPSRHRMVPCPLCDGYMHKDSPYCWDCRVKLQKGRGECMQCGGLTFPGDDLCKKCRCWYTVVVCGDCGRKFVTLKDWDDFSLNVDFGRPRHFYCGDCGERKYAGGKGVACGVA